MLWQETAISHFFTTSSDPLDQKLVRQSSIGVTIRDTMSQEIRNNKNKKNRRSYGRQDKRDTFLTGIFLGILLFFAIVGCAMASRPERSEIEKRELAEFPELTAAGIWDRSFFSGLQTWYADTYPLRESMISGQQKLQTLYGTRRTAIYGSRVQQRDEIPAASGQISEAPVMEAADSQEEGTDESVRSDSSDLSAEAVSSGTPASSAEAVSSGTSASSEGDSLSGTSAAGSEEDLAAAEGSPSSSGTQDGTIKDAPEVAGTILIDDGRGFETYYFNQKNADDYASMINTVRTKLPSDVRLYDMIVPNAFGVCLDEEVQQSLGASSQKDAIDYIYSRLSDQVTPVPVFRTLRKHNSDYIYFNTDHHWTALGAYYAYREFCIMKGVRPHDLSEFEERDFEGFLGSFYAYSNQSGELAANPDTVKAYVPLSTNEMTYRSTDGKTVKWEIIHDVTNYPANVKYSTFIGGDEPYSVIDNPQLSDGNNCLVVKESYGNAFVPFLVDHYDKVFVCDYRYYKGNLTKLAEDEGVRDVLFLNNTEAVVSSRAAMMNRLFR